MKIEHLAFNVKEPRALAQWYVENLGLRIIRGDEEPPYIHFLADDNGETILEIYSNPLGTYVDYGPMHPVTFHIAFSVDNITHERERLLKVGCTAAGERATTVSGDQLAFVRDPWGYAIQLVKRVTPLLHSKP
jgi:catechol 2,3-dioxygenase-like lactoylglutathione lyase family enzyme